MASARWTPDQLHEEVTLLGARGLAREELFAGLAERLRRVIDSDATCWHTLDPETRLMTSDAPAELVESGILTPENVTAAGEAIVRSEYLIRDVNSFAQLATRRTPVGILEKETRGHPERSARYRDCLAPAGIPHEMRAAFVIRGRVWGAVHMARRTESGPFTEHDAASLARVAGSIASAIRASLRFDAARRVTGTDVPGLVVLDGSNEVEVITPPARELLDAMDTGGDVPSPLLSLAAHLRSHRASALSAKGAVVTAPSAAGWLTLHASRPDPSDRVAIVIERASGSQSAAVRLEAHGATTREREVATLLARGLTNAEIARALVLSLYTVNDHVKSLFEKVGVATQQEFVARIFFDEYLPEVVRGTPLTSRGHFDRA
jgi:DNA-binding CsgD family transcriptional regulator